MNNSPFPGMDPYLEQHWRDVHTSLIIYARDQLQAGLPADLYARVEERICVENEKGEERSMYPDVRVVEHGHGGLQAGVAVLDEVDLAEPYLVNLEEPTPPTFVEIRDASSGNRVVTVIEFLSITNKTLGPGRDQYRQKQEELSMGGVNLVEVDLLRDGMPFLSPQMVPARLRTAYHALVRRRTGVIQTEYYALPLQKRLPAIRIPLRRTDADLRLNLQALVDQCYRNGRYHTIDYQVQPEPRLMGDDASWADDLLRAAARRK